MPVLIAVLALALAGGIAVHFYPATTVNIDHIHTDLLQTHTVYKADSIVLGPDQAQNVLFIATTVRVDNQLRAPIFLDDFSLKLTNAEGAELVAKAVQKDDLPNLEVSFPALKPLADKPLLRETSIEPGHAAQGVIVFSVPVPQAMWDARQSGVVQVDLYHHPSLYVTIPKA